MIVEHLKAVRDWHNEHPPTTVPAGINPVTGVPLSSLDRQVISDSAMPRSVHDALMEGLRKDLTPEQVRSVAEEAGISFCFAPAFHPALRHAGVARRELAVATVFNFLGPLANPGSPAAQAIGCADLRMAPIMAGVFAAHVLAFSAT